MATISIQLTGALVGTIISPGPNQWITRLEKTRVQTPAYQNESWIALPYPDGHWRAGRFVLRQGNGQRIISFASQSTSGVLLVTPTRFLGDLLLECLPAGEEWRIDFSDTPVTRAQAWAA
jgi:hypothetical protein